MLPTFVIGLREGLEAALVVGIVAAFLTRSGRSLLPMWIGVLAAVTASLAVGLTLTAIQQSLPQSAQEGMEAVIAAVAVAVVTGMILWMSVRARGLKGDLEASARQALGRGTSRALAGMAFLAVLREGFETSVFLLATFQASADAATAATGAVLGILAALGLGAGIYRGGVRLDLSRFFRATGAFLVLVAAGLVVTTLRTAHEAGWLAAGQQRTADLAWLAPTGSVRGSLVTGVLGIPADIRLVEVVGWLCYLLPMLAVVLWPAARRPGPAARIRIARALAGATAVVAVALAAGVRAPAVAVPPSAPLRDAAGSVRLDGGSRLQVRTPAGAATYTLTRAGEGGRAGVTATHLTGRPPDPATGLPASLTLERLTALEGGRVPVGIDARREPGPYAARWSRAAALDVWTVDGALLDATARHTLVVTLSGGGLPAPRTLSVDAGAAGPGPDAAGTPYRWAVDPGYVEQVARTARSAAAGRADAQFWGRAVPVVLLAAAGALLLVPGRRRRALPDRPASPTVAAPVPVPAVRATSASSTPIPRSDLHAG